MGKHAEVNVIAQSFDIINHDIMLQASVTLTLPNIQ